MKSAHLWRWDGPQIYSLVQDRFPSMANRAEGPLMVEAPRQLGFMLKRVHFRFL